MSAIVLEQDIVHYEVLGRGRPIVFLHDWLGSWRYWIPCMQTASTSFRAYAIDLWGFGDTAHDERRYALEAQVALVDSFFQQLGIGKVALVGHGLGALVAVLYALRYPGSVDRLMAVGFPMDENHLSPRLRTAPLPELADWLLAHTPAAETVRQDAGKTDPRAIQASLSDLSRFGALKATAQVSNACLLVHGQNDLMVETPRPEELAGLPEQTHQITLEGSGHFPMLDESARFNRLLTDFLALPSGDSPRNLQLKEEWKRRVR